MCSLSGSYLCPIILLPVIEIADNCIIIYDSNSRVAMTLETLCNHHPTVLANVRQYIIKEAAAHVVR